MGAVRNVNNLRNKQQVHKLMDQGQAELTDISGNSEVKIEWKLNAQAIKDKVFRITINGEEAYIDMEEWMYIQRIMF